MNKPESSPLFFCESDLSGDSRIEISGDEAVHILHSRRLVKNDKISLTDGRGRCATAEIHSTNPKLKTLNVDIVHSELVKPRGPKLILAAAIPKGERQAVMLNMATQLGMSEYLPLHCEYSVVKYQPRFVERWKRLIAEACKQSRRYYFPTFGKPVTLGEVISGVSAHKLVLAGDIHGNTISTLSEKYNGTIQEILMLVGPEGGFSPGEIELMEQKNVLKLKLGHHILRTETAAISLMASVNQFI